MTKTKIGTVEAIMLILTIIVPYTVISLPRTLITEAKSGIVLNIIFVTIIASFIALLICKLFKNFPGLDILDISNYLGGKVFQNIIGSIFIAYFIITSAMFLRNFCEGLKVVYYPMTNVVYIILMFIISLGFANSLGFNATLKTSTLILPFVLISILLLFIGNAQNFAPEKIFPVLGNGFYNTFVLGLVNIGTFGGIAYIYFLPPLLKEPKYFKKIAILSTIITGLFILLCMTILIFMFSFFIDSEQIMPLFSACRYIEFGSFFQRFESLFLLIWTISFCCYLSVACKFSSHIFKKICNIKNINKLTYVFALLIFGIALLPKSYAISRFFEACLYRYLRIIIVLALSLAILIFANLKKKKVGD